jgi:Lar family restriction alleviation protein
VAHEGLQACPFCGQDASIASEFRDGYVGYRDDPDKPSYFGLCRSCGATGARTQTEADAIGAWNRRAAVIGPKHADLWHSLTDVVGTEPWGSASAKHCWWCGNSPDEGHRGDCAWLRARAVLDGFQLQ